MRLRNVSFLTVLLFGLCGLVSLSWYTAFSSSRGTCAHFLQWLSFFGSVRSGSNEALQCSSVLVLLPGVGLCEWRQVGAPVLR
uniref:Uncharacterized protein n=1 Tax=Amphiprion percula TaxID=161767 RepID=A0A3P8S039_AMPPE